MKSPLSQSCLIVGCGYLGMRVARRLVAAKRSVFALTRSEQHAKQFDAIGINGIVGDVTDRDSLAKIPPVDSVIFAVGLDRSAGKSAFEVYVKGLENVLAQIGVSAEQFIYISSTGVYSQNDGQWIDESSPTEPHRDSGKACLQAESLLRDFREQQNRKSVVLRLAGIYGPERVPNKQKIVDQIPLASDPNSFLNLIHVDDAASAVIAAEQIESSHETILIADGQPVLRRDYYDEVARLYDASSPVFQTPDESTLQQSRGGTSKRIRNDRMRELLGFQLRFPSYREGLRQSMAAQDH